MSRLSRSFRLFQYVYGATEKVPLLVEVLVSVSALGLRPYWMEDVKAILKPMRFGLNEYVSFKVVVWFSGIMTGPESSVNAAEPPPVSQAPEIPRLIQRLCDGLGLKIFAIHTWIPLVLVMER